MADEEKIETKDTEADAETVSAMSDFDSKIDDGDEEETKETGDDDDAAGDDKPADEKTGELKEEEPAKPAEEKPAEAKPQQEAEKEEKPDEAAKPFDCGLSKEVYEPELVDAINKIGQQFSEKLAKLEAENAELRKFSDETKERSRAEAVAAHTKWIDGQFSSLGDAYGDVFGKGDIDSLDEKSSQFANRAKVDQQMSVLLAGYRSTNTKPPSREQLFTMAVNSCFPETVKQASSASASAKLAKRASQTIGKGSRSDANLTEEQKALRANSDFDDKLKE